MENKTNSDDTEATSSPNVLIARIPDLRNVSFEDLRAAVKTARNTPLGDVLDEIIDETENNQNPVLAGWSSYMAADANPSASEPENITKDS